MTHGLFGMRLFDSTASYELDERGVRFPAIDVVIGDTRVAKAKGEIKFNNSRRYRLRRQNHRTASGRICSKGLMSITA